MLKRFDLNAKLVSNVTTRIIFFILWANRSARRSSDICSTSLQAGGTVQMKANNSRIKEINLFLWVVGGIVPLSPTVVIERRACL